MTFTPSPEIILLRDVLSNPSDFSGWLYLPKKPWRLDTPCAWVSFDIDAEPGSDPRPDFVRDRNWAETLDAEGVQDVVANALAQRPGAGLEDLLQAFEFYVENDAFIKWDR